MSLTSKQWEQFSNALVKAFPLRPDLQIMVQQKLDRNLDRITDAQGLDNTVHYLIQAAEAQGWTRELVLGALLKNPKAPLLVAFAQQYGFAVNTPDPGGNLSGDLERVVQDTNSFLDVGTWLANMGKTAAQICRVELPTGKGTGFLVGPNVVITNYHVMADVITKQVDPTSVALRFDYKRSDDGVTISSGTVYRLADSDWLIDSSPYSPVDTVQDPQGQVPQLDQLDYALVRIASTPVSQPQGTDAAGTATYPLRKWLPLPNKQFSFPPNTSLLIMQHPQGEPLQLAIDTNGIIGLNANGTRLKYKTNTKPGSSGSPCFNSSWELIALHHGGDPNFTHVATYNEGIPFKAILDLLYKRGLKNVLEAQ